MQAALHASVRHDVSPTVEPVTGEVRLRISLYSVDEHHADVELVLSRSEAARITAHLAGDRAPAEALR